MKNGHWVLICIVCLPLWNTAFTEGKKGQSESKCKQIGKEKQKDKKEELKLEDMIQKNVPFGPSASNMAFSYDAKYGAYLYRPYRERRHGSDLHIYNVEKEAVIRITWPSVMAKFQKSTREVVEDRIKKAKESGSEDSADDEDNEKDREGTNVKNIDEKANGVEELKNRGDWVEDKDADAEKSPKYAGISRFVWSPVANEILLESEGDIYRYDVSSEKLARLTYTRASESAVRWQEDGRGYTYRLRGGAFRRVFGCEIERQLDPKLPNGDSMYDYHMSPDGKRMAILSNKQIKKGEPSKVEIANYRDRLMKSKEVSRPLSDDPLDIYEYRVYVNELSAENDEKDRLTEVFKVEMKPWVDTLPVPAWSPNSKKLAFLTFEGDPALVKIYEVDFAELTLDDDQDQGPNSSKSDPNGVNRAKEIYCFLHYGGPRTPRLMRLYYLADNNRIVYLSEQTGFRHLHVLDPLYETFKPLTSGSYEVYPIDISKDRRWIFLEATREHPSRRDIYRVSTKNGKMVRLTKERGVHSNAAVSENGTKVMANLVSYNNPKELRFIDVAEKKLKILTDSHPEEVHEFAKHSPEFFDYENRLGHKIYGMMFKPDNWNRKDKRPALIYIYGGPAGIGKRKTVTDGSFSSYTYGFAYYMAKKHGYVTCTIDTRGSSGYAGVFEKANFGQAGQPQVEDLVDGVKVLVADYGVDPNRIAIHGWSFGGFQTQMCMYTEPDVFKVGIAGAGPTEWENMHLGYALQTIGKSEPGEATLKEFSLLPLAKNLKGHLLLVHGVEDSITLYQDTVRIYSELLKAGKETLVELFIDPTGGHNLGGDVKICQLFRKYEQFLLRTIGRFEKNAKGTNPRKEEKQ